MMLRTRTFSRSFCFSSACRNDLVLGFGVSAPAHKDLFGMKLEHKADDVLFFYFSHCVHCVQQTFTIKLFILHTEVGNKTSGHQGPANELQPAYW